MPIFLLYNLACSWLQVVPVLSILQAVIRYTNILSCGNGIHST